MKKITTPIGFRRNIFSIKIILFSSTETTAKENNEISICDENPVGMNSGILLPLLFWPTTVRKNCSSCREKLLKFEAEGREFAKVLSSLE